VTDTVPENHGEALEAACRSVSKLISSAHGPLRRMHVQVGEVAVDVEWPDVTGTPASVTASAATPAPAPEPSGDGQTDTTPSTADERLHHVCAPGVGIYYEAPEPGADPFVREGDRVEQGQQIGILEVMKLMVPIEADRAGRVVETLVDNGQDVQFGEPLISIEAG
jgi:acetyl-CoA carboxylase biotin carboxyl carrier protein